MNTEQLARLDSLIDWAGREDKKRQAGLASEWDQSDFVYQFNEVSCGTACCIAGKVALEDKKVKPIWHHAGQPFVRSIERPDWFDYDSYGREALGIDYEDAWGGPDAPNSAAGSGLFSDRNEITDLRKIRNRLAKKYGHPVRRSWSQKKVSA